MSTNEAARDRHRLLGRAHLPEVILWALVAAWVIGAPRPWPSRPICDFGWEVAHAAPLAPQSAPSGGQPKAEEGASHESPGGGIWPLLARLGNFAILVGVLVYFLRSPLIAHLAERGRQVRSDLVKAAEMNETARRQLAEVDQRLAALPAELEALSQRGASEVAAEEARIVKAAELERQRLVQEAEREIDLRVRAAERDLVRRAAELAVQVASERLRSTMTEEDHTLLVDRYLSQVKS
jgi:F-type H+-transporting ATPase subunit b